MEELKQSQALLSRAEKFSFLGNLAARLAHEIKNPMTAIGTFIQLLPDKYDDDDFRNNFYQIAMEETNRVNNLVTELLDLVNTKESNIELNDLNGIIYKMILLVSPQTNAKKIKIEPQLDQSIEQIWLDADKIKQVILNLLSNAIDFTPEGGKIEIETKNHKDKDALEMVQIEIRDNGPGIPLSNIDNVFDPYFTTKHKSDMHKGTGLGLFIAHQNVQDHGGTIEVKSNTGQGAIFALKLPNVPPDHPIRQSNESQRQPI
jgi:signal transduction histidine kinase